jgi:hypothetical protein
MSYRSPLVSRILKLIRTVVLAYKLPLVDQLTRGNFFEHHFYWCSYGSLPHGYAREVRKEVDSRVIV